MAPGTSRNRRGKIPAKHKPVAFKHNSQKIENIENNKNDGPSSTLDDILKTAKLTYDSNLGFLQGDGMFNAPNLEELDDLKKLLERMLKELEDGITYDDKILNEFEVKTENEKPVKVEADKIRTIIQIDGEDGGKIRIKLEKKSDEKLSDDENAGNDHDKDNDKDKDSNNNDSNDSNDNNRNNDNSANNVIEDNKDNNGNIDNKVNDDKEDNKKKDLDSNESQKIQIKNTSHINETSESNLNSGFDENEDEDVLITRKRQRKDLIDDEDEDIEIRNQKKIRVTSKEYNNLVPIDNENDNIDRFIPSVYANKVSELIDINKLCNPIIKQLELFNEEENKSSSLNEIEFKKKKYAVSEYPSCDLKDLLPGEIPMIDFSGPKPTNQVAFTSFQAYVDPFFRNFTEEDIKFLKQRIIISQLLVKNYDEKKTPFQIPLLGPNFSDLWTNDPDGKPSNNSSNSKLNNTIGNNKLNKLTQEMINKMNKIFGPKGSSYEIDNSTIEEPNKISCGPLTTRILSAIVGEEDDDINDEVVTKLIPKSNNELVKIDYDSLDNRLKRELNYIGVYMNVQQTLNDPNWEQDWSLHKEDDEICKELRDLQKELKKVQIRNNSRKKSLIPIIEEQISWREYMSILEDLDKQVEQYYRRRLNVTPKKSKKRSHQNGSVVSLMRDDATHMVTNASFKGLLEKRKKWIEKIGPLFRSQLEMRRMPDESIFKQIDDEDDEDEEDEDEEGENNEDKDVLGRSEEVNGLEELNDGRDQNN